MKVVFVRAFLAKQTPNTERVQRVVNIRWLKITDRSDT